MKKEIKLLNAGYVRYIDHMGNDESAIKAARMSTNNPTGEDEKKDDRLRNYLWKQQHSTPTEMAELIVEIQLPIFVLRQIDRHRTLSYSVDGIEFDLETVDEVPRKYMSRNEFSGRYSEMTTEFYVPSRDQVKGQHNTNKQASGKELHPNLVDWFIDEVNNYAIRADDLYHTALVKGISKEIARIVLPLNKYTRIQLKGSLLSWFKFLALRDKPDVQWETRQYAKAIGSIVQELWPKSYAVFKEHTLHGVRLSKSEADQLLKLLDNDGVWNKINKKDLNLLKKLEVEV